jgi:hypothetical protein
MGGDDHAGVQIKPVRVGTIEADAGVEVKHLADHASILNPAPDESLLSLVVAVDEPDATA